jgi:hypothetical protein
MSEPPRRRRIPPSPPRGRSSRTGAGILPTIALGIGVVVAGLGIGAFLSALQNKNARSPVPVASSGFAVVTPVAQPSPGPVAVATIVARATPSPTPEPTDTPTPTVPPTAPARATPRPTTAPASVAPLVATAVPAPASVAPRHVAAAPVPVVITPAPVHAQPTLPSYAQAHVPTERPASEHPADAFAGQAQATVRRYLNALIAGDEGSAYAAFGATPGDPNVQLTEQAFLDSGARISSLRVTRLDASGATVEAELSTARGPYEATYHVTRGSNGPVIDQHDYIKV